MTPAPDSITWYKDAIIYELHIKAFRDGNGDGIGDFKGLLEKLDYLQDLGVTAIWLLPFYPSPQKDDGYDISDYYSINPAYGDIELFSEFLAEAHRRNLKVITELVINHTSNAHPWFERARRSAPGTSERDFYVWSDDPNKYKDVRIIFQDFETSNWTFDPVAQQYYWHRFFQHQPDLNYDNPEVQKEVFKILEFWCKLGVDGFRLDAVPYLFEKEGTNGENLPETHAFLKRLRKHVDTYFPGTLLLAEANMWPEDSASYFGEGDECQMNYHFPVMPRLFMSLQMEDRYPITDIFDQTPSIPDNCQWAIFLRNHDELTLEMVTDEERDYMYKTYVKDPRAKINLGIRHRLAPLLGNNRKKIELLNCLLLSLPGTPVLYYGDEIGMGDNFYLGDRNGVRTPMQWSSDRNAGFSEANPQQLYLPIILDPQYHYEAVNVDLQQENNSSLLWWMKRVMAKRKQFKVFGRGNMKFIACPNSKILAFSRCWEDQNLLVVVNLSRYTQPVKLELKDYKGYQPMELFSKTKFPVIGAEPYFLTLGGYACEWFLLENAGTSSGKVSALPSMRWETESALEKPDKMRELEVSVLPPYLDSVRWFGGKGRVVEKIAILQNTCAVVEDAGNIHYLLISVNYENGLSELYQLALAYADESHAAPVKKDFPAAVLATITMGEKKGILYDAFYSKAFQKRMFENIFKESNERAAGSKLRFYSSDLFRNFKIKDPGYNSRILSADQSNTCILYDDQFFLKLFRKVDFSVNPDVEITQFLTKKHFSHIPSYLGQVQWKMDTGSLTLGMLQEQVPHNTDGWNYMLDQLHLYYERVLSQKEIGALPPLLGSITEPITYDEIPDELKSLISGQVAEQVRILGTRTGEMHACLATATEPDFMPEPYTLHYQRSLYSGLLSLVRATFQSLSASMGELTEALKPEAQKIVDMKEQILREMKKIYGRKINATRIRIHGDYHLGQILFTGKDFVITDFEGEPARSFSERRMKRSPLRDVAGMIRSFHYAAHSAFHNGDKIYSDQSEKLVVYAEQWYHYISCIFMKSYLEATSGLGIIPAQGEDFSVLIRTFLLEKAVYEINYEINNRPEWVGIPLAGVEELIADSR